MHSRLNNNQTKVSLYDIKSFMKHEFHTKNGAANF